MKFNVMCLLITALLGCPLVGQDETPTPDTTASTAKAATSDNSATIELTKSREIKGELAGISNISIDTKFGEATIPLNEVDGIKLHTDENDSAIVAFKNGDSITGQMKIETLSVTTDWGDANIKIASIETILLSKSGRFYQDTSSGGQNRWRFGETRAVTQNRNNPARTVQPVRTVVQPQFNR